MAKVEEIKCQVENEKYGHRRWPDHPPQDCNAFVYRVRWVPKRKSFFKLIPDQYKPKFDEYLSRIIAHGPDEGYLKFLTRSGETVMNLATNAVDAMPAGGKITISTRDAYIDKTHNGFEVIPQGEYAILDVSDTGIGMPVSDLDKIFEPFYTKKYWVTAARDSACQWQARLGMSDSLSLVSPLNSDPIIRWDRSAMGCYHDPFRDRYRSRENGWPLIRLRPSSLAS